MKRIIVIGMIIGALWPSVALAGEPPSSSVEGAATAPTVVMVVDEVPIYSNDPALPEYYWQVEHGAPGVVYWKKVAHCETRGDWKDHGTWAGGLGIFTQARFTSQNAGTWERWGGEQFALHPSRATPIQQIVVANRIAMFGWKATYRDWNGYYERVIQAEYYKKPAGFNGWGCIKQNRSGPRKKDRYLNPTRFENAKREYWKNGTEPFMTHNIVLPKMNIPKWAWSKIPHKYLK